MSIMDYFTNQNGDEDEDKATHLAERLMRSYAKWNLLNKVTDKALDYTMGSDKDKDLAHREKILDINVKRKALGLPMDDDLYQEATNDDLPFRQKGILAAFGKHVSNQIPERGFLEPKQYSGLPPLAKNLLGGKMTNNALDEFGRSLEYTLSNGARPNVRRLSRLIK